MEGDREEGQFDHVTKTVRKKEEEEQLKHVTQTVIRRRMKKEKEERKISCLQ